MHPFRGYKTCDLKILRDTTIVKMLDFIKNSQANVVRSRFNLTFIANKVYHLKENS